MWDKVRGVGAIALGIGVIVGLTLLALLMIRGGAWLGVKVFPFLQAATGITVVVAVLVLLPLTLFRATRGFAAGGLMLGSYVLGLSLWVWSLLLTYSIWGGVAVFIGLFLFGVGIVPVAMLATLFHGMWSDLGQLVLGLVMVFGSRMLSIWLSNKVERDRYIA